MERQLAAIMFTDIAGYTSLMGRDEERAFQLLRKNRNIQRPLIQHHGGTWLKEIGDGILSSFRTVSQAVSCAIEIQHTCRGEADLQLRIGIHEGEVVFEDHDVFGDGINIASRLQALAPVGKIWVSESVHKNVLNKKDIRTAFVKEKNLRNVREPVRIFEIKDPLEGPGSSRLELNYHLRRLQKAFWAFVPSVAVLSLAYVQLGYHQFKTPVDEFPARTEIIALLPFAQYSDAGDGDPFAAGLQDDLVAQLSKIEGIKIVPDEKGLDMSHSMESNQEVGNPLEATALITGMVHIDRNEISLRVELMDVTSGKAIWIENYTLEFTPSNVLEVQRKITLGVAEALDVELSIDDLDRMEKIPTEHLHLYQYNSCQPRTLENSVR